MYQVSLHADAEEELNEAAAFYERRQPSLGDTFLQEVSYCFRLLQDYPLVGTVWFEEYRRYQLRQFPYGIVYRIDNEEVFVLAVAHSSRRPEYWRQRR